MGGKNKTKAVELNERLMLRIEEFTGGHPEGTTCRREPTQAEQVKGPTFMDTANGELLSFDFSWVKVSKGVLESSKSCVRESISITSDSNKGSGLVKTSCHITSDVKAHVKKKDGTLAHIYNICSPLSCH